MIFALVVVVLGEDEKQPFSAVRNAVTAEGERIYPKECVVEVRDQKLVPPLEAVLPPNHLNTTLSRCTKHCSSPHPIRLYMNLDAINNFTITNKIPPTDNHLHCKVYLSARPLHRRMSTFDKRKKC